VTTLIDWGSGGWKGVNDLATNRPGWEQPGYDDSAWPTVTLPLGSNGACPIHSTYPRNTHWPVNTYFLLRRELPGTTEVRFVVDNAVTIYWNGVPIFGPESGYKGTCPERDEWGPVLGIGPGVLALECWDTGVESYADVRLEVVSSGFQIGRVGIGPGFGVR